ncbi:YbaB/EbfC family nucleoid-associated protein [Plantactinospora sp. B5E13]|uniref:YbaB/EbfC family nucleoid-associated protein n=1 Tax=unclassified Plantactinospora TaxID=2631981 RepID=UPI00325CB95D
MTSPLHDRIEQAYAEFERQKQAITEVRRELSTAQTTVTAKNRALTVTVDGRGDLVEIRFPTNSYRTMAPAELANLLMETVKTARDQARGRTANAFQTLLPTGLPLLDMLNGTADFDDLMRETVRVVTEPFPSAGGEGATDGR